jgi:VCBS repeat-containing protein
MQMKMEPLILHLTFQVSDGTAYSSSSSTMTINVTPVNDAPTARDDTGIVNEDAMLTVSNSGNAISVAGASHDGTPYAIGEGSIRSLTFNHDGTKMFVVHASTPAVISEHALTTAFDITTASQSTTYDVSSHTTSPRGLRFNSDGTKLYLNSDESSNKKVYEFSLSTAYDISSLPTPSSTVISGQDGNPRGIAFNTDGSKMFLLGDENDTVYEYSLSTPFDTTTISYTNRSLDVSSKEVTPRGLSFNSTGTKLFITGQNSDDILEYDLSTGFNLSIASFNGAFDMTGTVSSPNDVVFNNDGSKAFIGQTGSNKIFSFSLSSPFSLVDITGENTGDVLDTSSSSNSDSDADASASLTVTAIRVGSSEDSGAAGSIGSALTGTYGQLTIAEDGSYSYVANQDAADALDAGDIVTDSFNYTVSDGTATDTAVITITVIGVNDAPTALDNSITTNEDTNHVFSTGEFNFSDDDNSGSLNKIKITSLEDNGALQYYNGSTWVDVTENQEITAADITSGYLRFKPDANENGADYTSFDFQVSDGTAYSSSSSTMTINVTPVNDAPASSASSVTTNEDTTHTFTADDFSFTDDDGDTLSSVTVSALIGSDGTFLLDGVAITGSTTVSKADIDAGLLTFVPDANENGSSYNTFTFTVNDGTADSGSSTMTVNVTPVNDAPTSSDATININENNQESSAGDRTPSNITYTFSSSDFAFTDTESGAAITHVKIVDLPTSGTLNLSETAVTADEEIAIGDIGSLVYTPDANSETDDSFTFKVSDGTDYSTDPNTINVSVNAAPNVTDVTLSGTVAAGTQTSVGDIRRVINSIDVVADSDDDDSDLVVTGVAAGNESTNSTIITDGTGVGSGLVGTYGSLTILANGTYGYSAFSTNNIAYGATATDTFTFTIRDDETASGSFAYDVGTITITVGASISLTNDDDTATEGTPITVTGAQDDVLNDDTVDTDGLVVTNISHDNGNESVSSGTTYANGASLAGDYGTLVIGANGSYTFTPNDVLGASETGTDVFTYTADGATATLSIEVTGTNDAPTITASTENNFIEGAASENDTVGVFDVSDIDTDDNSLTVTILSGNDNSYYQISYDDAGTATVTLTTAGANYVNAGNDLPEYTVQVSDGSLTATASHNPSVNLSPSVTDDSDTVTEGGTVQDTDGEGTVLSDDSDNEDTLSVSGTVTHTASDGSSVSGGNSDTAGGSSSIEGTYGTLTLDTDGSYSYVATTSSANALGAGDSGTDTFTFLVSDGNSTTSSTIQFTVNGVNDAPTTVPDTDSVAEGGTVVETTNSDTGTVLSDDNDEDGDTLSVSGTVTHTASDGSSVSGGNSDTAGGSSSIEGTYGTLTLDTDGSYSYVATTSSANALGAGDSGTDTFTFLVSDGTTTTSSTIQFTVNGVNDAPTARDDTGIVNEDATLTVSNSSDATTSVTAASFVRSKSLGDAGYQSMETKFSPDGTKMFVLDTYQNTNEIHQYTLTTAFDISSASFDGADETFDLSNENSSSSNFTFNNDGTKFYSAYSGRLYEYDVSTAYDISTSSYNNNFFDLILEFPNTGNMGAGVNVAFNSDGTKLFALDAHQREVHEYSLSTAFDVTSASRTNNYVSVGTQEASPYGFAFSNDGKKMFISGFGADVNEYTLSTGFDLSSTFEFVGSFDVSSKDSYPFGITFNNDGTKMFMTGSQQDKLFEYSLTTPFSLIDVSGEHSGDVINTSSTDNYDTDPEGDALTVTTYSHTSATDQDGGSISSTSSTGTAGTNNVTGYYGTLDLEGNGSYTYTADLTVTQALDSGDTVTDVFTYTVDDGNGGTDTATITITVIGMNDAPVAQNDVGVIVEDGTLRVTNSANANVSGSYDATGEHSGDVIDTSSSSHTDSDADASASLTVSAIRTGSSEGSGTAGSIGSALTGTYGQLTIAADGSYSYEANQDAAVGDSVTESFNYTLSDGTATDIGVITITILGVNDAGFIKEGGTLTVENSAAANSGASTGNHTGDITDNGSNITSITATTAGRNAQTTFSSNSETVIGEYGTLTINSDGSYSYVANSNISGLDAGDANIKDVFTYIVSDGSTTSTATLTMNIIASQDLTARDDNGTVNEDATLEVDDGDNLTTVAPASYDDSDSFTIAGSDSNPVTTQSTFNDLLFNPDGTKMYTLGSASGLSGRSLFQYTLSIPFDVSTASVSSNDNADVGGYELYNEAMRFNNDGTKLFVLSHPTHQSTRSYMYQYTLSTPYDITSTVTAGNSLLLGDQYDDFRTFLFNDDGSEMFIIETGYLIYKYTLSDPFDTSTASKTSSYLSAGNAVTGMQYNNDGTKLFTVHQTATIGSTAKILQWSLSTAYDLMTASSNVNWSDTSTYFDTGETTGSLGNGVPTQFITFNNDGSKFFSFNHTIGHGSSDPVKIKEWNLASPFNLTNDVSGEHSGDVINTSSTANYDTDPDSDTLTVTAIRTGSSEGLGTDGSIGSALDGTYGQLTIAEDGSYTYVANKDAADALDIGDVVTDTFNYTVSDGQGETDIAVLTITVNGVNDAPTAVADTDSVDAGSAVTDEDGAGTLVSNDTDPDASPSLYVTKITHTNGNTSNANYNSTKTSSAVTIEGTKGTLTFGSDGSYSYAANSDATSGDDVFTYTLTDGTSTSDTTLTISVTEIANNAPTITAQTDVAGAVTEITDGASGEGTNDLTDTGSFTIADLDNDNVTVSSAEGTTDAVGGSFLGALTTTVADDTDDGSGQINWTYTVADADVEYLEAGETVTETFTVTVSDGNGGTVDQTVTVVITGANDAPTLTTGAVDVDVNEASDASAQDLSSNGTITFADLDETTTITAATSTVTGSSGVTIPDAVNTALLSAITVTDNSNNTASWTLSASSLDLDFLTAGQTITLEKVVTATDGEDETVTDTITVTITGTNDTPTLTTGAVDVDVNEASDASAQDLSSNGTITFADLDETTTITAATSTVTGSSGVTIPDAVNTALLSAITVTDNSNNTASWTLSASSLDLDFLTAGQTITLEKVVTATDGEDETVTDTITVTITGTNDTPTLTTGAVDVDVNEASDASAQDLSSNGTITFADLDETTTITAATSTVTGSSGVTIPDAVNTALLSAITVTDNSNNTASWTLSASSLDLDFLTAGQTITLEKVVTATDGEDETVTDTITVTITGTNDTPTITAQTDVAGAVTEITDGASGEGTNDLTDTGSFTIADLDNDNVTVSSAEGTTDAVGGSFLGALTATVADDTDDGSGQINWTYTVADADVEYLEAGETVTETFTVTVSDGNGGTVDQTVTVVITGANDAPTLTTGAVDVDVNEASDASAQDLSSNGTITFADLDETTTITAATSTVTGSSGVTIPDAVNTALLSAITVTDNSNNTASWTLSASSLDLDFLTAGQTITLEKVVTATDGEDETVTDTITVTITGTNDAPTLTTGAVDVDVNEASDASAQDLSSNGTITFADLDETTTITAATSTVTGSSGVTIPDAVNTALLSAITVTDNSNNTASWTLSASSLDLDFLTAGQTITLEKVVTATDGEDETVTDTITVTITGTNDAPTLTTGAVDVDVNEASDASAQDLSSNGTITFADLDETTTITAATSTVTGSSGVTIPDAVNTALLSAITVTDNSNNTASWTLSASSLDLDFLTAGQTITLEKVVTATDGEDETVTDTITVTITGTNDAPTANDDTISVAAGTPATGNVVTNDTDPDGDSLTVSAIAGGSVGSAVTGTYGTFTLNSDGSYTYTVDTLNADVIAWQSGDATLTETFTYTVSDGNGGTDTATITVNAIGQNDAPTSADNTVTTNEDTDHTFDANEFGFTDPDGDSLDHVTIETLPSKGTLLLDGSAVSAGDEIAAADITNLVFRPAADGNGDDYDSFTFSVNDGIVDSGSYTMTVNVDAVNDAPTITATTENDFTEGSTGAGDTVGVFDVSDIDTDDNSLTVTILSGNDNSYYQISYDDAGTATVTLTTAGANYVNAGNDLPEYTVQVSDGSLTATTSHNPTTLENTKPEASDNTITTLEDTSYTFSSNDFWIYR